MRTKIGSGLILAAATLMAPCVVRAQSAPVEGDVEIGAPTSPDAPSQPPQAPPAPVQMQAPPPGMYAQPQQPVYVVQPGSGMYYGLRPREYFGGPIPAGTHLGTSPHVPLIVAGAVTFGVPWFFSLLAGAVASSSSSNGLWLIAPVFGPIGFAASQPFLDGGVVGLLVLDAIVQAGGVAMLIAGVAIHRRMIVPDGFGASRSRAPQFAFVPMAPGALGGASLALNWF